MTFSATDRRAYPKGGKLGMEAMRDGWPVRVFRWDADGPVAGSLLFQGGRGDIIEKYLEVFAHWHSQGWNILAFDWRGQGGSGRLVENSNVGHSPGFSVWVDDLAEIVGRWTKEKNGPHIIIGHSMGGHLVLRALAEQRIAPRAAVLVSPMLGFDTGPLPLAFAAWLVARVAARAPERQAWKNNERPSMPWTSRQRLLTSDLDRYADELWWKAENPALVLGPPSLGWLQHAYESVVELKRSSGISTVDIPMLVIGTKGDGLVDPRAIPKFAARLPNHRLLMFEENVAHEILRECDQTRDQALAAIDALLLETSS